MYIRTLALTTLLPLAAAAAEPPAGYYRFPAIHGDVIVFTAEGDLWQVDADGGSARRLTSHPGQETHAAISPDGTTVAFSADYEGPTEVYVMALAGGLPRRLTWEGREARVIGWTPVGEVIYATRHFSTLPNVQLVRLDPESGRRRLVPLAQASEGVYQPTDAPNLFFTRERFQGSYTKRYRGGTAQNLWRFAARNPSGHSDTTAESVGPGREADSDHSASRGGEAVLLTGDFHGTSREPMWWAPEGSRPGGAPEGRVVFVSDRNGTMNLWSMTPDGGDLRQHTRHVGWDVKSPDLSRGRVVYQLGADLHLHDLGSGDDRKLEVTLASDFDQRREAWLDEPMDYLTAAHLSPDGKHLALTARGQVFVTPVAPGRLVEAGRPDGVRFRSARFLPSGVTSEAGPSLVVLSDESGEVELWRLDARGVKPSEQLTDGGTELRFDTLPSPDGQRVAYLEKDDELWLLELETGRQTLVARSDYFGFRGLAWSPDSRWLAFAKPAENRLSQIMLYNVKNATTTALTSDRFDSYSPAWGTGGEWIYFLSDRNLVSLTSDPWGSYQPGPLLDRTTRIYQVALKPGLRSPFDPPNELTSDEDTDDEDGGDEEEGDEDKSNAADEDAVGGPGKDKKSVAPVEIALDGLAERLHTVPVPPGNYSRLSASDDALFWLSEATARDPALTLKAIAIGHDEPRRRTVVSKLDDYELSGDGKKLLIRRKDHLYVAGAKAEKITDLGDHEVDLDGWTFPIDPREEWRQMFRDAWRLLRDYFYDPGMHGVDWPAMLDKYLPLVDRVTDRAELSDLFGELTGELSALHQFVRGGDLRQGPDQIHPASLGAVLERDEAAGGYRVTELYVTDPDLPEERPPLSRPGVDVSTGDVLLAINGVSTLSVPDPGVLLRNQADRQVLLEVKDAESGEVGEAIVEPITPEEAVELRYDAWEYRRRLMVEEAGDGDIGYVHLRAMGGSNYSEWARHYFPVFHRKGLIIDVRHNRGGNIDSWILGSLLRRPWMWWKPRTGSVYRNMQFAFGGHMVVLVNEHTASDGEAFAEGFRRLGLGKIIGRRTWGGEIWLTSSNVLVDRGIATAAEFGVYGPEGEWLIEGHGVEPDIAVDNLPHATFLGEDSQLSAAIEYLQQRIHEDPPVVPEPPPYPDKSLP